MNDLNCWQTKFEPCYYSERLLVKIALLNQKLPLTKQVNIIEIKKAIYYAKKYHGLQIRQSGEPYYSHPIEVAYKIADYCFKENILVTSILHDTLEDTDLTKDMLKDLFDCNIAEQVESLTRIKPDRKVTAGELVELLCKEEKEDLLLIKYFDRLHNMETIKAKSSDKILKTVEETLKKFISLSIYLEASLPELLKANEELLNLCCKQLLTPQSYSSFYRLMEISGDNFQLPFPIFQSEQYQN